MHDLQVFFQIFRGQAGQFSGFGQGNGDGTPAVDIKPVVGEDCVMGFQAQADALDIYIRAQGQAEGLFLFRCIHRDPGGKERKSLRADEEGGAA